MNKELVAEIKKKLEQRRENILSRAKADEKGLKRLHERREVNSYLFEHSKPGAFRNEVSNDIKNVDSHIKRFSKDIKQGNVLFSDLDDAIKSLDRYMEDKK